MRDRLLGASFALICIFFVWLACLAAQAGAASGIAHGIGPHLGSPTTISVGRLYYRPGGGGSQDWQTTDDAIDKALAATAHAPERARKLRCDQLHAEYVSRHGLTTPRPLRGFTGCEKYKLDAAYWRHRRDGSANLPSTPWKQIGFAISLGIRQEVQF